MTTYQCKTFGDLISFVRENSKADTADETTQKIKRIINVKYQDLGMKKKWSWRGAHRWFKTTPEYSTGTASITNADRNVTLSAAATVTDDWKGRFIRFGADSEYYEIIAVTNAASRQFALSAPYKGTTTATSTYVTWRGKYGLWPDFADLYRVVPMTGNALLYNKELEELGWSQFIRKMSTSPFSNAQYPTHCSVQGKEVYQGPDMGNQFIMGYDFMDNDEVDDPALWVYPGRCNEQLMQVFYGLQVGPLIDDSDEPLVPREKRVCIGYMALADWYLSQINNIELSREFEAKANKMIREMVADHEKSDNQLQLVPDNKRRNRALTNTRISYNIPNE